MSYLEQTQQPEGDADNQARKKSRSNYEERADSRQQT